jgi:hypothetical protein
LVTTFIDKRVTPIRIFRMAKGSTVSRSWRMGMRGLSLKLIPAGMARIPLSSLMYAPWARYH